MAGDRVDQGLGEVPVQREGAAEPSVVEADHGPLGLVQIDVMLSRVRERFVQRFREVLIEGEATDVGMTPPVKASFWCESVARPSTSASMPTVTEKCQKS